MLTGHHPEIVKYLIDNYLDSSDSQELNDWLYTVAYGGNLENVKYLVKRSADPNVGLEGACEGGKLKMVKYLVEQGADPKRGLEIVDEHEYPEIAQFLRAKTYVSRKKR